MSRIKDWAMTQIYELDAEGYTMKQIADILDCDLDFVKATLGYED